VQLRAQAETHPQMLKRMIVMLLNIAGLAERSASYPAAARAFVLFILHRAEAYAWDYFTDIFEQHPESFGFYSGASPEDALELADSFRKLAAAIQQSLIQDRILASWWGNTNSGEGTANGLDFGTFGLKLTNCVAGLTRILSWPTGFAQSPFAGFAPIPRLDSF